MTRVARRLAGIGAADLANTAAFDAYVGPARELTVDPTRRLIRLHDGVTPGGNTIGESTGVSVTDFGASPAASAAVNRAAFQAAINSVAATGGVVKVPAGTYNVDSTAIVISSSAGIVLQGEGVASIIQATSATGDVVNVTGQFVTIQDVKFQSSVARTSGSFLNLASGANRFTIREFMMQGAATGITVNSGIATATIENGFIFEQIQSTGIGIKVNGGFDISIRDIVMDGSQSLQPLAGICITNAGDVTIEDCNIIGQGADLLVNPGAGQSVTSLWCNNSFFDTAQRGVFMNPTGGGTILRSIFEECWMSSHVNQGVLMLTSTGGVVDGVDFTDCHVFLNSTGGFNANDSGVKNVKIIGGQFSQNTGTAVNFNAGVTNFAVVGATIGAVSGFAGNGTGLAIAGTCDNFVVEDNIILGNTVANVTIGTALVSTKIVRNNIGFVTENFFTVSGTTNGTGDITFAHGCASAPSQIVLTPFGGSFLHPQITAVTATTITIHCLDAAGAAVASTAITIYAHAKI